MTVFKVRSIAIALGFEITNLKKAQEFEDSIENLRAGAERLASMARKAAMGIAAIGTAAGLAARNTAEQANEIRKNSAALGTTIEKYQELRYALQRVDMDVNDMMDTFVQVTERVNQAATGSERLEEQLAKIGISAKELIKRDPTEIFLEMAGALRNVESATDRVSIASQVLGEEAARKLLPVFSKTNRSLEEYIVVARRAGIIMSREQVMMADRAHDSFSRVNLVLQALRQTIGMKLIPIFEHYSERIWDAYVANQELIDQKIDEWIDGFERGVEVLENYWEITDQLVQSWGGWGEVIKDVGATFATIMGYKVVGVIATMLGAVKNLTTTIASVAGVKVIAVFTAIATIVLVAALAIEDMVGHMNGAESLVGWLKKHLKELPIILRPMALLWIYIGELVRAVWNQFQAFAPSIKKLIPILKIIGVFIGTVILGFVFHLIIAVSTLVLTFSFILGVLGEIVNFLGHMVDVVVDHVKMLFGELTNINWSVLGDDLKNMFFGAIDAIGDKFMGFISRAKEAALSIVPDIGGLRDKIVSKIKGPEIPENQRYNTAQIALDAANPSTATARGGGGGSSTQNSQVNNVDQKVTIEVKGGDDPRSTARETKKQFDRQSSWTPDAAATFATGNR